tara:strand:- start:1296 stop:1871 length:576 start_codon:yes stop_codon:yes gene_type:complete
MNKKIKKQSDDELTKLHDRLKGGHVARYHTRPELSDGQNVAAHTWRAMVILQTLWPDVSKNCLLHLLYHDVAEAEMGDVPATTKWNYPEINELMVHAEKNYEALIGVGEIVHQVTEEDKKKCDIADKLELVLHCYRLLKQGNLMGQDVLWNGLNYIESNYSKDPFYKPVGKLRRILWNQIKKDLQHSHRYC